MSRAERPAMPTRDTVPIEDGLRSRTVRAMAAVELLNEDGEDTPRSAGWVVTAVVAGWPATTPCLRWNVNCGRAAR